MRNLVRASIGRTLACVAAFLLAAEAQAHGDLHLQIEQLSAQLRQTPEAAELWHKRGELYRAHHDYSHALADYARAERLDPTLTVVQLSRGRTLFEAGQLRPALRAVSGFLQKTPGHAEALLLRARVQQRLGARDAAEQDFAAALAVSPDPAPDLFLERAQNLTRAKRDDDALAVLAEGSTKLGPLVTLDEAALEIELRLKRYAEALKRVDAMVSRTARNEHLLVKKAEAQELAGDREGARATRERALAQIEALPEAKRKLASTEELTRALQHAMRR